MADKAPDAPIAREDFLTMLAAADRLKVMVTRYVLVPENRERKDLGLAIRDYEGLRAIAKEYLDG